MKVRSRVRFPLGAQNFFFFLFSSICALVLIRHVNPMGFERKLGIVIRLQYAPPPLQPWRFLSLNTAANVRPVNHHNKLTHCLSWVLSARPFVSREGVESRVFFERAVLTGFCRLPIRAAYHVFLAPARPFRRP